MNRLINLWLKLWTPFCPEGGCEYCSKETP